MFAEFLAISLMVQPQILFPPTETKDDFLTTPVPVSLCDALRQSQAGSTVTVITFFAALAGGGIFGVLSSHYGDPHSVYQENMGLTGAIVGSFFGSLVGYIPASIWTPCYIGGY